MKSTTRSAYKFLPLHYTALVGFFTVVGYGEPELFVFPAVVVRYGTESGKYHQLQVKGAARWENVGYATKGTGKPYEALHPAGEYRVISPSCEWVVVWADEFEGDDLDYGKWEKEVNNYGGGNNERQAYRTDPKYCFVKDGNLSLST